MRRRQLEVDTTERVRLTSKQDGQQRMPSRWISCSGSRYFPASRMRCACSPNIETHQNLAFSPSKPLSLLYTSIKATIMSSLSEHAKNILKATAMADEPPPGQEMASLSSLPPPPPPPSSPPDSPVKKGPSCLPRAARERACSRWTSSSQGTPSDMLLGSFCRS